MVGKADHRTKAAPHPRPPITGGTYLPLLTAPGVPWKRRGPVGEALTIDTRQVELKQRHLGLCVAAPLYGLDHLVVASREAVIALILRNTPDVVSSRGTLR
jgi:hypothetical protein